MHPANQAAFCIRHQCCHGFTEALQQLFHPFQKDIHAIALCRRNLYNVSGHGIYGQGKFYVIIHFVEYRDNRRIYWIVYLFGHIRISAYIFMVYIAHGEKK